MDFDRELLFGQWRFDQALASSVAHSDGYAWRVLNFRLK